ncbi:heavy metal-associated isoprenylated plant protein 35-like [Cucurbita maxima]|uniref:Heavy metal-associated isoprenylated plant protein 35-like n=1 Tax=Cucurbita maxima TaxID=3661 RepID=A0A6J1IFZ8_CUCMA|nr:heavy metal-associated isoprenylated plant protein 35-like [Cucurbita maxima]XP_022975170.1 heavy metal-associated isoprenylated plant protein 35-like [Cucurbita maxima]
MAVVCAEAAPQPLRAQVWILKVSIHCEGCKRKVKKVLQSIDGVYTTIIDSEQQKVTVTGNVSRETLTKRLARAGKQAEIWPEKPAEKEKQFIKMLATDKGNGQENGISPSTNKASAKKVEFRVSPDKNNRVEQIEKSKNIGSSIKKLPAGESPPVANYKGNATGHEGYSPDKSGVGQSGEKKKKKGHSGIINGDKSGSNPQNGHGTLNVDPDVDLKNGSPLAQQIYMGPKGYYFPPPTSGLNYYAPHLVKGPELLYHVPPIPFSHSNDQTGNYEDQAKPQTYLDYFSEENAHGCIIM